MEEEKHESKGKKEHKAQEDHTHPADMTSQWIIALAVIQVILLAVVAFQLYDIGKKSEESKQSLASINAFFTLVKEQTQPTGNDAQPSQPSAPSRVEGDLKDDDVVQGDANAPVTIVEFSDFQCPYCGRNFEQTYPQIKKLYIDTGKVKYVMRDFPLNFHPEAQKAAEAAGCAEEQGKFWEMHDKLFSNQQDLSVARRSRNILTIILIPKNSVNASIQAKGQLRSRKISRMARHMVFLEHQHSSSMVSLLLEPSLLLHSSRSLNRN